MIVKNEIQVIVNSRDENPIVHYVKKGMSLDELLHQTRISQKKDIIAAILNNVYSDLTIKLNFDSTVYFISVKEPAGLEIYRHTAIHLLSYVINKLFKRNVLNIGPSIQYNYYFDLDNDIQVTKELLLKIQSEFANLVQANNPIEKEILSRAEAIKYYQSLNEIYKINLIKVLNLDSIKFYKIKEYKEMCPGPLALETGIIKKFNFLLYPPGFLLEFPKIQDDKLKILRSKTPKKLSKVFLETRDWHKIQGVSNIAQLNDMIIKNKLTEIITISEALHEKKISQIADKITDKIKDIKLVLIAGPSSSGKTTFAKRLHIQLRVNGIIPLGLSLDNYFVDREKTPKDENGNYNFESLEALDLELLNYHLNNLLDGKEIQSPVFDFHTGKRKSETIPLKLEPDQIIIIEGIHGLNDALTFSIPKDRKYKIYVSALSQLRLNNIHRISTTDTRLFRRIVRDFLFRSHSALDTIKMWPSVRNGEEQYIFPFQENADIMFNTSLIYEGAVLKSFAQKNLLQVPHSTPEYAEAKRLLNILDHFMEISAKYVPKVSIIREFIGGSSFKY